jgi:hypothetical protein
MTKQQEREMQNFVSRRRTLAILAAAGGVAAVGQGASGTESKSLVAATSLRKAFDEAQKKVTISIDLEDLKTLKDNNYRLCFAKKVAEGKFNVVWQSYDKYLASNDFSWVPLFQLFGTNVFQGDVTVNAKTNMVKKSALDNKALWILRGFCPTRALAGRGRQSLS